MQGFGLEEAAVKSILVADINNCINEPNIAKKMHLFIHIYPQVKENISEKTRLTELKNEIQKRLSDLDFRKKVELFYKIYESEAGSLIFDDRFDDKIIYRFKTHEKIYKDLTNLNIEINFALGTVKRFIHEEEATIKF